ncbi:glycogen/starch synthase [Escherichia coli]
MIPSPTYHAVVRSLQRVGIYLIDAPHLYDFSLEARITIPTYLPIPTTIGVLRCWVGRAEMASGLDPFWRPDVVHAHDWHAGLAPAYLAARGRPAKSALTVHNLAYQGMFYAHHMNDIQLPWSFFNIHGSGIQRQKSSWLKAGLDYADYITRLVDLCSRHHRTGSLPTVWKVVATASP